MSMYSFPRSVIACAFVFAIAGCSEGTTNQSAGSEPASMSSDDIELNSPLDGSEPDSMDLDDIEVNSPSDGFMPANLGSNNIFDTLEASDNYSTFTRILKQAGFDSVLSDENRNFTVFAPADKDVSGNFGVFEGFEGIEGISDDTLSTFARDDERLSSFLNRHIVEDVVLDYSAASAQAGNSFPRIALKNLFVILLYI